MSTTRKDAAPGGPCGDIWTEKAEREVGSCPHLSALEKARVSECGRATKLLAENGMGYAAGVVAIEGALIYTGRTPIRERYKDLRGSLGGVS